MAALAEIRSNALSIFQQLHTVYFKYFQINFEVLLGSNEQSKKPIFTSLNDLLVYLSLVSYLFLPTYLLLSFHHLCIPSCLRGACGRFQSIDFVWACQLGLFTLLSLAILRCNFQSPERDPRVKAMSTIFTDHPSSCFQNFARST